MPATQVATVANYDFGAPAAIATVLSFRTRDNQGGKLALRFENDSVEPYVATLQVSPDGTNWTTVSTVDALEVPAKQHRNVEALVRAGVDKFVRLRALGNTRGQLQIRPDSILEIVRV